MRRGAWKQQASPTAASVGPPLAGSSACSWYAPGLGPHQHVQGARFTVIPHPTCREKTETPQQHAGAKLELAPLSVNGFTQISKAVKEPKGGTANSLTPFTF